MCRQLSRDVVPSSEFIPVGAKRDRYIDVHDHLTSKKPCRYFELSKKDDKKRFYCPLFNKCKFAHEVDGKLYFFSMMEIRRLKISRREKKYVSYEKGCLL